MRRNIRGPAVALMLAGLLALSGCGPDNDTPGIPVDDIYVAAADVPASSVPEGTGQMPTDAGSRQGATEEAHGPGSGRQGTVIAATGGQAQMSVDGMPSGGSTAARDTGDGGGDVVPENGTGWISLSDIAGLPGGGHAAGGQALDIPEWQGDASVELNGGRPFFDIPASPSDARSLSALDQYDRPGAAYASIGPDDVRPGGMRRERDIQGHTAGWTGVSYEGTVTGGYLYNNRRLIPWLQDRSSDGKENLLTATRYLSDMGLSPIEDMVSDFIARTGMSVAYRATPVYDGGSLVCDGVVVEAASIGDGGEGLSINVFCYNIQPGVEIDYWSGLSRLEGEMEWRGSDGHGNDDYIIDLGTGTFHRRVCAAVAAMNVKYREERRGARDDLVSDGYLPCKVCQP